MFCFLVFWSKEFITEKHFFYHTHELIVYFLCSFTVFVFSGVIIIWLTLPLLVDDIDYEVKKGKFGWDEFAANNARAIQVRACTIYMCTQNTRQLL